MTAHPSLLSLALLTGLLAAPAALADDDGRFGRRSRHRHEEVHVHGHRCEHRPPPMPAPPAHGHGRYELRTVQTWVPGYSERVWVPETCRHHPRKHRTRCKGGYYSEQWVEGHYEQRPEWVWVAAAPPAYHEPVVVLPPPPPGRPAITVRVRL